MKIAVTGGTGRIGQAVISEARSRGHEMVSIDRVAPPEAQADGDVRKFTADLSDYEQLLRVFDGCDALVHMAAIPSPGRHPDHVVHNNNVVGSYNALRAAAELGIHRVCQASSVNAIGLSYSRAPRFDYFPIDEMHPNYNEEPYGLSKWICEQQADSFARRYESMQIASMRFHWVVPDRATASRSFTRNSKEPDKHLWAYTTFDAAARACLLSLEVPFGGHEVFYVTAPDTTVDAHSRELAAQYFPNVPIRGDFTGNRSFFASAKAEKILGWAHDPTVSEAEDLPA